MTTGHDTIRKRTRSLSSITSIWMMRIFGLAVCAVLFVQFRLAEYDNGVLLQPPHNNNAAAAPGLPTMQEFVNVPPVTSAQQQNTSAAVAGQPLVPRSSFTSTAPHYYMVFSTSCSDQQNWESYVFFYHAFKVKQPGNVTRIVSGCTDEEETALRDFHQKYIRTMSDRFNVHFTPSYSALEKAHGKHPYKYMNKPYGLRSWMTHALGIRNIQTIIPRELADSIVMLLDPDMILLRPLLHDFSNEKVIWVEDNPATKVVKQGFPISQQDGYLHNQWIDLNFSHVTDLPKGEYIEPPSSRSGPIHWNSGPPYLATVEDMYRIADKWTEYAPRVLQIYPELFAEMYGFIIACVQLKLPFTFIKSLVVSTTETPNREGWAYIDALPDDQVCAPPYGKKELPIGLHYCKRYMLGNEFFFSKYRLKKNIMDCEKPLLKRPPPAWAFRQYDYAELPPPADLTNTSAKRFELKPKRVKREAFMLCQMTNTVNEALRYLKQQKCGASANLAESYSIHEDPTKY